MLRHDAVTPLLETGDPALVWAVRHDILGQELDPRDLWGLPEVERMTRGQRADGSWAYPGGAARSRLRTEEDYTQLATYKELLVLVSKYRLDRRHPAIRGAAKFLLGRQAPVGDIRGIYGTQYTPNYTGDILALLIQAGYQSHPDVLRGIRWLLAIRQDDGGWALPLRTVPARPGGFTAAMKLRDPIEPVRSRPSSHLITGVALRALAAHPVYRRHGEATAAAHLLAGRFFQADRYDDHKSPAYWTKLTFPFRWTDVVSSLDVISQIGLGRDDPDVARGIAWLVEHQRPDGLWESGYPITRDRLVHHWVTFGALRACKRLGVGSPKPSRRVLQAV